MSQAAIGLFGLPAFLCPKLLAAQPSPSQSPVPGDFSEGYTLILAVVFIGPGLLAASIFGGLLAYAVGRFYETEAAIGSATGQVLDPQIISSGLGAYYIRGAKVPTIGRGSTYELHRFDDEPVTGTVTWHVIPEDAEVSHEGSTAQLKPRRAGPMLVTAQLRSEQEQSPTDVAHAAVSAAPGGTRARRGLPFLGSGYGTLLALPIVLGMVGALGVTKVLDGQGVAAAISAIVGFVVGHSAAVSARSNGKLPQREDGPET